MSEPTLFDLLEEQADQADDWHDAVSCRTCHLCTTPGALADRHGPGSDYCRRILNMYPDLRAEVAGS